VGAQQISEPRLDNGQLARLESRCERRVGVEAHHLEALGCSGDGRAQAEVGHAGIADHG
jgi:hypothetical protein